MTQSKSNWLEEQKQEALDRYEQQESDAMSYQYAAEAETYHRIKNDSLMFGSPKEALQIYKRNSDTDDYGMTAGRVRAIKRYLKKKNNLDR